jgi:hypothetical protein
VELVGPGVEREPGGADARFGDGDAGRLVGVEDLAPRAVDVVHPVAVPEGVIVALRRGVERCGVVAAGVAQRRPEVLAQAVCDIDAEAVHAQVEPEPERALELGGDLRVLPVQVGLLGGEDVHVPLPVGRPGPGAAAELGLPVRGRLAAAGASPCAGRPGWGSPRRSEGACPRAVQEVEAVAGRRTRRGGQRLGEPGVLVGAVVRDDVDDDLQAVPVGAREQVAEVAEGAVTRVDATVVGDVVPAVGPGRGEEGRQPERVDAEPREMAEAVGDAAQIAHAVAVGVGEAGHVDLVDDGLPPPVLCGFRGLLGRAGCHGVLSGCGAQGRPSGAYGSGAAPTGTVRTAAASARGGCRNSLMRNTVQVKRWRVPPGCDAGPPCVRVRPGLRHGRRHAVGWLPHGTGTVAGCASTHTTRPEGGTG